MIPIVFWASLPPCPKLSIAADANCSRRNQASTLPPELPEPPTSSPVPAAPAVLGLGPESRFRLEQPPRTKRVSVGRFAEGWQASMASSLMGGRKRTSQGTQVLEKGVSIGAGDVESEGMSPDRPRPVQARRIGCNLAVGIEERFQRRQRAVVKQRATRPHPVEGRNAVGPCSTIGGEPRVGSVPMTSRATGGPLRAGGAWQPAQAAANRAAPRGEVAFARSRVGSPVASDRT
jgi:hypothetical protein